MNDEEGYRLINGGRLAALEELQIYFNTLDSTDKMSIEDKYKYIREVLERNIESLKAL